MSHNKYFILLKSSLIIFFLSSCTSLLEVNNINKNNYIDTLNAIDPNFIAAENLLYVDIENQSLIYLKKRVNSEDIYYIFF